MADAQDVSTGRDYRETVFLPTTAFPMRAGLPQLEPKLLEQWAAGDLYHSVRAGEDPMQIVAEYLPNIRHIQIADVPGRHQPGTGELDFERFFSALDDGGYEGWVSLEYHPAGATERSFEFIQSLGLLTAAT